VEEDTLRGSCHEASGGVCCWFILLGMRVEPVRLCGANGRRPGPPRCGAVSNKALFSLSLSLSHTHTGCKQGGKGAQL
jgi:hypothetical protein